MKNLVVSNINNYIHNQETHILVVYVMCNNNIKYSARLFINNKPTKYAIVGYTLKSLLKKIPKEFQRVKRHSNDNNKILGSYIRVAGD